ncbi:hypothetical protein FRC17_007039 [Serendipita sp. 399]|nr:hypothetical protein FRC17_007039 [Serendipita sp. 399]
MFRSRLPNFATAVVAIVLSIFNESAHARNVSNVLIYSHTVGFRHDSIPAAVAAMTERGPSYGINFVNTEDPSRFNDAYLSQFDALFFLHTTGDVLDEEGQEAFQNYLDNGGNFVAAHAAANCLPESTVFEATLGSQFAYHPQFQNATYVVERPDHPSTVGLPARWRVPDEVYNFVNDPRRHGAVVVLSVDEDSYEGECALSGFPRQLFPPS